MQTLLCYSLSPQQKERQRQLALRDGVGQIDAGTRFLVDAGVDEV